MEGGYGTHDYAITVRDSDGVETTHVHSEERTSP
jgi:hypothetical protein